jgi:hypothetical protein
MGRYFQITTWQNDSKRKNSTHFGRIVSGKKSLQGTMMLHHDEPHLKPTFSGLFAVAWEQRITVCPAHQNSIILVLGTLQPFPLLSYTQNL